jgi:hypothetical protein
MSLSRRSIRGFLAVAVALAASLIVACPAEDKPGETPPDGKPADKPADPVANPADPKPADPTPTTLTASHPECVGPMTAEPAETLTIGDKTFERKGSVVTMTGTDPDDELAIGQITDVKDWTAENCANLRVVTKWFVDEKVDLIAVTGDLGESVESIEKVVREVAKTNLPVVAIAGNRECRDHFTTALTNVQKDHKNVINMNTVRVLNTDDASLVSMPGYYNRNYIHCAEGCEYTSSDVAALLEIAKSATAPVRVLVSHGPPKQNGPTALDRIHEDVNVGDPEMTKVLQAGLFPFGLFGNIQEAGGYATDLSGEKRVAQDAYADQLYMNPGPVDAVRWAMLDGSESLGMAGIMRIKGKQAKYKIYRVKAGEAKPESCQ